MISRLRGKSSAKLTGGPVSKKKGAKLFGSSMDDAKDGKGVLFCSVVWRRGHRFGCLTPSPQDGIPKVLRFAKAYFEIHGVETEGLFRITSEVNLDELVEKLDKDLPIDISAYSGHTMAGLLKRYFREMPDPFIPEDLYEACLTAVGSEAPAEQIARVCCSHPHSRSSKTNIALHRAHSSPRLTPLHSTCRRSFRSCRSPVM
jgi:hypothetical protein